MVIGLFIQNLVALLHGVNLSRKEPLDGSSAMFVPCILLMWRFGCLAILHFWRGFNSYDRLLSNSASSSNNHHYGYYHIHLC